MRLFLEELKSGFWRKNLRDLEKEWEDFFQVDSRILCKSPPGAEIISKSELQESLTQG